MKEMIADLPSDVQSRVAPLLADPTFGYRRFTPATLGSDTDLSNCFGTTVFCLNIEDTILAAIHTKPRTYSKDRSFRAIWSQAKGADRPGYVDDVLLGVALQDQTRFATVPTACPGDLVVITLDDNPNHAGIALGVHNRRERIFHQRKYGGPFEISTLEEYRKFRDWRTLPPCTAYRVLERKIEIPSILEC